MREKALILLRGKAVYNGPEHPSEVDLLPRRQPEAGKHLLQRLGKAGGGIIQYAGLAAAVSITSQYSSRCCCAKRR